MRVDRLPRARHAFLLAFVSLILLLVCSELAGGVQHPVVPAATLHPAANLQTASPEPADGATDTVVSSVSVGANPYGVAYDSARGDVYVTNRGSSNISVISDSTNTVVASVALLRDAEPEGLAYDARVSELFVAEYGRNSVAVVSDTNNTVVRTIGVGDAPTGVAYDTGMEEVFVSNLDSNNVSVISDATDRVVASIDVGESPLGLAYDSGTNQVFVADSGSNQVSVISDATDTVTTTITVGTYPYGVAYDAVRSEIFVTNFYTLYSTSSVSVISDATDEQLSSVGVGANPFDVAYSANDGKEFVTNYASDDVSVISDLSDSVTHTVEVGSGPTGVAYDGEANEVFVANYFSSNVSVISDQSEFQVTLSEAGLPPGSPWFANITGGTQLRGTVASLDTDLPNGTYAYTAASDNKTWAAAGGSFKVNGTALTVRVIFTKQTFTVTFTETGALKKGPAKALARKGWTVVLNGTLMHSTGSTISFGGVPNGTYPVLVTGPSGLELTGSGQVTVKGTTLVTVTVTKGRTVTLTFHERKLTRETNWCVTVDGYQECSAKATIKFADLTPGAYSYAVGAVAGYSATAKIGKTPEPVTGSLPVTMRTTVKVTFTREG